MRRLRIVSATRQSRDTFKRTCLLGTSMHRLLFDARITSSISCDNTLGLPTIYNRAIADADEDDALLFVHDDVFIHDFNLSHRIEEALAAFDVVGLAGNVNPNPNPGRPRSNASSWMDASWRQMPGYCENDKSALTNVSNFTSMTWTSVELARSRACGWVPGRSR